MKSKSNTQTAEPRKERDAQVPGREQAAGPEGKNGSITRIALTADRQKPLTANKLTKEQRRYVYQLLAAGYRNTTILKYIKATFGIKVSRQSINAMKHGQSDKVEQGRREIEKEIRLAAPIASKLHRVAKRQELIESLERRIWRVTSETKSGVKVLAGCHEVINRILDSVKAELEPFELNVQLDLREQTAQQYKDVSDNEVIAQAMEMLKASGMEIHHVEPKTDDIVAPLLPGAPSKQ